MSEPKFDAAAVVREIEAEAQQRRASGDLPPALLAELDRDLDVGREIDAPEEYAVLQSARPLRSDRGRLAPHIIRSKRVVRRLLAWYIQPIAEDQTRFNLAILRELRDLQRRVRWLEPAFEAPPSIDPTILDEHVRCLAAHLRGVTRVRVLGGDEELRRRLVAITGGEATGLTWDELATAPMSSLPAIMLVDSLNRMTPAQVQAALPLAAAALEAGGTALADLAIADDGHDPSDPSAQRALTVAVASGLFTAAGLVDVSIEREHGRAIISGRRRSG